MPRVLLTRPAKRTESEDAIHRILQGSGVDVMELPMLNFYLPRDTDELDASLRELAAGAFDYTILTSPTAVDFFHERLQELGLDKSVAGKAHFGAVGAATSEHLKFLGYTISIPVPINAGAHELSAYLTPMEFQGKRVLLLQSQIGLEHLEKVFTEIGADPKRVTLYLTKGPSLADSARLITLLEGPSAPDVIAFFSPSSVSFFIRTLAEMASGMLRSLPAIACIGETTAKAVEEALRRRPEIVARKADQSSLANDILTYLRMKKQD